MNVHARWRRRVAGWMAMGWIGVVVALLVSGCAAGSPSTWERIGPDSQSITSLALSSQSSPTLFAGSSGQGLYRSQDGGDTWNSVNSGLPSGITINGIVLDQTQPGLVYLGTNAGVFLSTSDGDHWQSASQGLPTGANGTVTALLVDPDDPMTLYAGTAHNGVYISHNGAKSWAASAPGALPAGATVHALLAEIKGQGVLLFAALAGAGVYQSSDKGASWSARSNGLPAGIDGLSLLEQSSNPGGLYVGTSAGIYWSTDDGANWKAVNGGLGQPPARVFALELNDQQAAFLYAATSTGVYRSADGGAEWGPVAAGLPAGNPVVALAVVGSSSSIGTIYTASGQVYRYPSAAAATSGRIFTFIIIGLFVLLFLWLFFRQRRLLQRVTMQVPPRPGEPAGERGRAGFAPGNAPGARHAEAAEGDSSAASSAPGEASSDTSARDRDR